MGVEFELTLESRAVLSVDLVGQSPEDSLPNKGGLGILKSQVILIITTRGTHIEVEISDIEPETDCQESCNDGPDLEPTLGVDIVQCEIRVTLKWSPDWETVGCVLLGEHTKSIDDVWSFEGQVSKDVLLSVVVSGIEDSLLQSEVFVVVLSHYTGSPFTHPLGTVLPVVCSQ